MITSFRFHDRRYHLVLPFEDNGQQYYILKYYGRYKQWWHYEVVSDSMYEWMLDRGTNKKYGKKTMD